MQQEVSALQAGGETQIVAVRARHIRLPLTGPPYGDDERATATILRIADGSNEPKNSIIIFVFASEPALRLCVGR